ncbi:hypothetical protein D9M70_626490 [compost metagenome]
MRPANRIDVYSPIIEPFVDYLENSAGKQMGDPAKAVEVMLEAVDSDTPPVRLMLGADAYALWDQTIEKRMEDMNSWRQRGIATAFEGAQMTAIGS